MRSPSSQKFRQLQREPRRRRRRTGRHPPRHTLALVPRRRARRRPNGRLPRSARPIRRRRAARPDTQPAPQRLDGRRGVRPAASTPPSASPSTTAIPPTTPAKWSRSSKRSRKAQTSRAARPASVNTTPWASTLKGATRSARSARPALLLSISPRGRPAQSCCPYRTPPVPPFVNYQTYYKVWY